MSQVGDARARKRKQLADQAGEERLLCCRVVAVTHRRAPEPVPPCKCCGSTLVEATREWVVEDVLIDRETKRRWTRSKHGDTDAFLDAWDDDAVKVMYATIPEFVDKHGTTAQDMVDDMESKVLLASGGNRSGKTELGVSMTLIRWAQWGGIPKEKFRIVGFELKHAHIVMQKLLERLPTELVEYYPPTVKATEQNIRLADGTDIQLRHAKSPGSLKGDSVKFTHWTEASETEDAESWIVSLGRTAQCGGQIYLDTTPGDLSHWIKVSIIDKIDAANAGAEVEYTGRHIIMSIMHNPWIREKDASAARAAAFAVDPTLCARDFDGEWIAPGSLLWHSATNPDLHLVDALARDPVGSLGLHDITRQVTRAMCRHECDWLIGVDINRKPTRGLACKVVLRDPNDSMDQAVILVCDVITHWDKDAFQSAEATHKMLDGRYAGACVVMDGTSCHDGKHPTAHTSGRSTSPKIDWERNGFHVMPPTLTQQRLPCNPKLRDSVDLVRMLLRAKPPRLMMLRSPCMSLWEVLLAQQDAGDGTPIKDRKKSHHETIHCSHTDPLRYVAWALFGSRQYGRLQAIEKSRAQMRGAQLW